jgi:hypothetical protein
MSAPNKAPDGIATAILLEYGKTSLDVEDALSRLAVSWALKRVPATPETCTVLKRVRVPALIIYNNAGEETCSAIGDLEIVRLIESLAG